MGAALEFSFLHGFISSSLMEVNFKLIQPGENYYFTLCSPDFLAIGGGSHFALYLDNDLWEH